MSDLLKYLDTDYLSYLSHDEIKNFDIMKWWKSHESTFPVLSKMARDLLSLDLSNKPLSQRKIGPRLPGTACWTGLDLVDHVPF